MHNTLFNPHHIGHWRLFGVAGNMYKDGRRTSSSDDDMDVSEDDDTTPVRSKRLSQLLISRFTRCSGDAISSAEPRSRVSRPCRPLSDLTVSFNAAPFLCFRFLYVHTVINDQLLLIRMEVASSRPDYLPTLSTAKTSKLYLLVKHHILAIDEAS